MLQAQFERLLYLKLFGEIMAGECQKSKGVFAALVMRFFVGQAQAGPTFVGGAIGLQVFWCFTSDDPTSYRLIVMRV